VALRGEVEDGVNIVPLQAVYHLRWVGDVALVEAEVSPLVERPRVVERAAIIELVEGDDVVRVRVCDGQVADQPASAIILSVRRASRGAHEEHT
jgi:hypothetical protein